MLSICTCAEYGLYKHIYFYIAKWETYCSHICNASLHVEDLMNSNKGQQLSRTKANAYGILTRCWGYA